MRPSRGGKPHRDSPRESDDNLMFPLEMEGEQPWVLVKGKKPKNNVPSSLSSPTSTTMGRSQPMNIQKNSIPLKKSSVPPPKSSFSTSSTSTSSSSNSIKSTSNHLPHPNPKTKSPTKQILPYRKKILKKPQRPNHFSRLSAGDLDQLSDDDDDEHYDIDPEACEQPVALPTPSPAERKAREDKIAAERQKHLLEIEVPRSSSPPGGLRLCQKESNQQHKQPQQLTVPDSFFVKQNLVDTNNTSTSSYYNTNNTELTLKLSTVLEEQSKSPSSDLSPTTPNSPPITTTNNGNSPPPKIKNALAIAVKEAKEKKAAAAAAAAAAATSSLLSTTSSISPPISTTAILSSQSSGGTIKGLSVLSHIPTPTVVKPSVNTKLNKKYNYSDSDNDDWIEPPINKGKKKKKKKKKNPNKKLEDEENETEIKEQEGGKKKN